MSHWQQAAVKVTVTVTVAAEAAPSRALLSGPEARTVRVTSNRDGPGRGHRYSGRVSQARLAQVCRARARARVGSAAAGRPGLGRRAAWRFRARARLAGLSPAASL